MMEIYNWYFILINVFTFLSFGVDKEKSIKGEYRTPEKTLLKLAFMGGGFGALFGMLFYHHKTLKRKFKRGVPLAIIFNGIVYYSGGYLILGIRSFFN